jgi:hypothetical protein
MECQECCDAVLIQVARRNSNVGRLWALRQLEITSCEAANACVYVPDTGRRARRRNQVILEEYSSPLLSLRRDDHIAPFDGPCLSRLSYLHDGLRAVHVVEELAIRKDDAVAFANNAAPGGKVNGI